MKNLFIFILVIAVIALIIAIKINPAFFTLKSLGSFEYIRTGEELLNKGKYREAIDRFEKAYEASPENETVKSDLVYAYSRYGTILAESEKYDEAIDYMTKACDITQNAYTMQNLAIIYSKRALLEARKSDWIKAVEDLTNARLAASDSNNANKNLGLFLFNNALDEFKSGNDKAAILFLKEASLAYDDSRILEFLGDVYYKRTELEKASFYWNKSKGLNSQNGELDEKLAKLKKEIEISKKEEAVRLPHFEIRYEKDLPIDLQLTNEALEKAYVDVGKDLAYYPKSKTTVFFYSQGTFKDIFKLPNIIGAFYDGNIRMPFSKNILDRLEFIHYIYHEYAHAVVSAKTNNNCPAWLSEGIAVWEEYRGQDLILQGLLSKLVPGFDLSIHSLDEAFKAKGDYDKDMRPYYLLAYTVVKYIVDDWGIEDLRAILVRMAGGQHVMNAIDDEFLLSEKEFDKRWKAYIKKRHGIPS